VARRVLLLGRMNDAMKAIYETAKRSTESTTERNGQVWGSFYLDSARPAGMSAHAFAGYLSALEAEGLYRSMGDDCFGEILLDGAPKVRP
jgi:hypothetical protein